MRLAGDMRDEVDPIDGTISGQLDTSRGSYRWQKVYVLHGRGEARTGRDHAWPPRHERNVGATFEVRELPAAIGVVHVGQADVVSATVV